MTTVRLRRDRVIEGYSTPDGRFTVAARRHGGWLLHDTRGRARWPDPLIPRGNSHTTTATVREARRLIAEQYTREGS